MSLLSRKKTILAKIETTYGVDANPTGSADAVLAKNVNLTPISAELVSRDLLRSYFGNSESLLAQKYVQLDFEVELVGNGVVGGIPNYDELLRACGFKGTLSTAAVAISRTGTVATATLAAHGFTTGSKVVISGATQPEYNGTFTISNVTTNTFDFTVSGTPATPATGSPVVQTKYTYAPVSAGFESTSIYYQVGQDLAGNSPLHKLTGCFGTVEFSVSVKQIPTMKFSFTGIYNTPVDASTITPDYTGFMIPQVANTQQTPVFSLFGSTFNLQDFSLNVANDVQYITLIGAEYVKLLDRKPAGNLVFEAPLITTKDFFTTISSNTKGVLNLSHGSFSGYKVALSMPSVLLGNPSYQDSNGIQMLSAPYTANPVSGNDELTIAFS